MNIDYHSQLTFRQAVHNCGYNLYHINKHFQPKLSLRTEKAGSLFRGFRAWHSHLRTHVIHMNLCTYGLPSFEIVCNSRDKR